MIHWNPDPAIFTFTLFGSEIGPRYYSLAFVFGFLFAEKYIGRYLIKNGYSAKDVSRLFSFSLIGTIVGARLGHCLFYEASYYLSNPLKILKVWEGGLASHGGFLGVMLAVYLFNRTVIKKVNYLWLLDLVGAPALLTGSFIRIGNLMNSEILGHATDLPWAFIFERIDRIPRHPSQLYEAFGYFSISMIGFYLYKNYSKTWPRGRFVGFILTFGMAWRFFTEFFKNNQVAFESSMILNLGQMLSIPMMILGIMLMMKNTIFGKRPS